MIRRPLRRALLVCLLGTVLATATACTTSKLLVGALYNRADDKALDAADDWVGFTDAQRAEFAASIGTFHTWHRRHEMPRYATLMRDVAAGLSSWDQATPDDFRRWFDGVRALAASARDCHPARYSIPLSHTLDAAQIDRMETRWRAERAEHLERSAGRTRTERIDRRVQRIDTWVGRMGVSLDQVQLDMIRDAFVQQKSLRDRYQQLSDDWTEQLFVIARDRTASDYDERLAAHIDDWFQRVERHYPEEWRANRDRWLAFAVRFEKTLSRLQRREALAWIDDMADTLDAISQDEPDWLPADDPAYGCAPEAAVGSGAG